MSWHFVSATGEALGPVGVQELQSKYECGDLTDETYVWNGAEVSQWTPLNKVASLYAQVKPSAIPKPPSGGSGIGAPPRRTGPAAPRTAVLTGIQAKQKSEPEGEGGVSNEGESSPNVASASPVSAPRSGGGPAKMTMQEQMSMVLKNRNGAKNTGPTVTTTATATATPTANTTTTVTAVKTSAPVVKAPTNPNPVIPKKTEATSPSNPRAMLLKKNTLKSIDPEPKSTTSNANEERLERIKSSLSGAEEWQLRAIEKLLS